MDISHLGLRIVEEVVDETLLPRLPFFVFEAAQAGDYKPHVQHGHLRPSTEGRW